MDVRSLALTAKKAARVTANLTTEQKNQALRAIADSLQKNAGSILEANTQDLEECRKNGLSDSLLDRLLLDKKRLESICQDIENVIDLEDFVGQIIDQRIRPNGLRIERVRVPLGVILMIYEARPNVTVDAAVLCLKSGNSVILRGGKEALHTNKALVDAIHQGLEKGGVPPLAVQFVETTDRAAVTELMSLRGLIDVVIPRGGKGLIDHVVEHSKVPVIETGSSPVHVYVDESADLEKAAAIAVNSKTRRVSICNTLDVLLVHEKVIEKFLPMLEEALGSRVELRADTKSAKYLKKCTLLDPEKDFDTEYLDYILSVHMVSSFDEALDHIFEHGRRHSEAIITENIQRAEAFLNRVDSACVYVNASTQFSDGAQFGLGAEIGISTQKLHVRGPFALEGLTTTKWKIYGNGQIRPM